MRRLRSLAYACLLTAGTASQERPSDDQVLTEIASTASCAECRTVLFSLKALARFGDQAVVNALTTGCIRAGAEDEDVCKGIIAQEGPIVARTVRNIAIPSRASDLLCTVLLAQCDVPKVRPHRIKFPKPKPNITRPAPSGQKPTIFVHFSDVHVDLDYEVGSSANCSKPICCRSFTPSDAPGNNSYPAGPYGNHNCDSPKTLEQSFYNAMERFAPDAKFALFTGDVPEHHVWLVNQSSVTRSIEDTYQEMSSTLRMPVYGTLGNHEAAPVNSYPFKGVVDPISSQWVYDVVSNAWSKWIGKESRTADEYGAYSYKVPNTNLRIISLNTNLFYKFNLWVYEADMQYDPNRQFKWLVDELQSAEDARERVYIMGHMPPGVNDALHDGSNHLDQIVNRYDATIAAMFWGHTHKESFELSYSNHSDLSHETASMVSYISPSLTPTSGSPAFRVLTVDPVTFGILDVTTYSAPLEHPKYQQGPMWSKYASAKETYGQLVGLTDPSSELTPAFWHNVTEAFESDDDAFQAYFARKSRGWDNSTCTGDCKKDEICQIRAAEAQYNCQVPNRRFPSDKSTRKIGLRHDGDECSSSGLAAILQSISSKAAQRQLRQAKQEL
ncbi:uncharacterized protein MYCFIDRAFT_44398 [Pseudocercospora fijiensis CIRAD86]|uniref:Sphingomyelin phosphodiesterase n=1 Tax=Pseudocercospora fijiensis (strain CIRAD86) TaxID=383855 RepID=M3B3A2_PSEFD|nr:uncharacterized protein MYCFIDRAFT_44398 [Pseudocercospora fijiensis CIRAD86]EME83863.1 hypothetical protein MYCFIDRAFT_44398 [Pseudocercospora fijiensis CIRAD86]